MKRVNFFLVTITFIFVASCVAPPEWHDKFESVVPDNVTNIRVENVNGGAFIYYTYPQTDEVKKDLLGVKATYTLTNGEHRDRFASIGVDSLELEGFGDTQEYPVILYTVHKSGNVSSGVPVTIKPLDPVISTIRETVQAHGTFGGIYLTWENPMEKAMGVSLYVPDESGKGWVLFDNFFSSGKLGKATFRPFAPVEQKFMVLMFDRWGNKADTAKFEVTPLKEEVIVGKIGPTYVWSQYGLNTNDTEWRGDIKNYTYPKRVFTNVLDGLAPHNNVDQMWNPGDDGAVLKQYIDGSTGTMPFPLYFTIDMGRKAQYTRLNIKSRLRTPNFSANLPVNFTIWGSNNPKPLAEIGDKAENLAYWTCWRATGGTGFSPAKWQEDGTWTRIATCRLILSSGTSKYIANMALSTEDLYKYTTAGYDFDINEDTDNAYRYLRFEVLETNTDVNNLQIVGISFWGLYAN